MTTTIIVVAILIVATFAILHDPVPRRYRRRICMGADWRRKYPGVPKAEIRRFLGLFVDAFAFRERDRLKFGPQDRVLDVYRAIYDVFPKWMPVGDSLECETLVVLLEEEYQREFPERLIREDVTLGEIFEEMTGMPTKRST